MAIACLLLAAVALAVTWPRWLPRITGPEATSEGDHDDHSDDHDHDHGHVGRAQQASLELSPAALKNIGYAPATITPTTFVRTITVPAIIIERPGRSQIEMTAPVTGLLTTINPIEGAAIEPGAPLFEVRLTHEELVTTQSDLIGTAESLQVVNRELERLQALPEGVVAGKRVLEQEYEKQKLEASLRSQRQALLLHGLGESQVDAIVQEGRLIDKFSVDAPTHDKENEVCGEDHLFHVQKLFVTLGQQVVAGEKLCVLADHCELYIEGRAFEDDAASLREALRQGWDVTASLLVGERVTETIKGLKLLYLADHVDTQSRAFRFYISLPNEVVLDRTGPSGHRFLDWRFKPGQRMELRVPVEELPERIVLPVEAVVAEGAETYVYRQNGSHFDRVSVHVEYRDRVSVVIASDGAVFPGDVVAGRGAYQMHLALKNQGGGGIDPHAGHNH
jgi:cobalt-zinc-cadmium efflux system membrane fusion protein